MLPKSVEQDRYRLTRELEANPDILREHRPQVVALPERDLTWQPRTDAGNADRLMVLHGEHMRWVRERKTFIVCNGPRWEFDLTGQAETFAIDTARETYRQSAHLGKAEGEALASHARNSEAARAIRAALDLVRCTPDMTISAADLDTDPFLLGLPNGVLDLRTQKLIEPDRAHLITKAAGIDFDPHAQCPNWLRFLGSAMGSRAGSTPEQRQDAQQRVRFLQKACGLSLSGDTADKVLFALLGPTNSGKTTFLEAVRGMLGDYAGQILVSSLLANGKQSDNNSQADIADLIGLRFVTTSEAESQHRLEEGKLKYLTQGQGTKLKAARKYENPIEFRATHKLWMDTNELPRIKTTDDSVWNRLKPIPFEYRVADSDIDRDLPHKLKAELAGILRWAIEGFRLWQLEGLGDPPDVAQARQAWRDDCDPLGDFITENCRLDPDAWTPATQLRQRYEDYCRETGDKFPLGGRAFGARLKALGLTDERRYDAGQTQRGWQGIELV